MSRVRAQSQSQENAKHILDVEGVSGSNGMQLSTVPVELKSGDWIVEVIPWIGGRIVSMEHCPSGAQWLHSRIEIDKYEEYSGTEYRSAGCLEEYSITERHLEHTGEEESLTLKGDIRSGLILHWQISIPKDGPNILQIDSSIVAYNVGVGSGGFSWLDKDETNKFSLDYF